MKFPCTMQVSALLLALSTSAANAAIVNNGLSGNTEYDGWDNLSSSALSTADLASGFGSNEAGSGDAVLTRQTGGFYPASASLYSFSSNSILEVADATAIAGLETVVFTVQTWANPSFGDGSTAAGSIANGPTLNLNGGADALAADYIGVEYLGPFSGGGFDVDSYAYTYQWDLSSLGAITSFDLEWEQIVHAGVLALQLEQSDSFTVAASVSAVPVPAAVWLMLSGVGALMSMRRRETV
jgi:hypothetical protein